jgi:hypothetical protein
VSLVFFIPIVVAAVANVLLLPFVGEKKARNSWTLTSLHGLEVDNDWRLRWV